MLHKTFCFSSKVSHIKPLIATWIWFHITQIICQSSQSLAVIYGTLQIHHSCMQHCFSTFHPHSVDVTQTWTVFLESIFSYNKLCMFQPFLKFALLNSSLQHIFISQHHATASHFKCIKQGLNGAITRGTPFLHFYQEGMQSPTNLLIHAKRTLKVSANCTFAYSTVLKRRA
jgi:hypothetical protein